MTRRTAYMRFIVAALAASRWRRAPLAQDVALPEPVAQPAKPTSGDDGEPEIALDVDREIDLANVVTSAAKGVTTVQEAPAIITIITADEIKARGHPLRSTRRSRPSPAGIDITRSATRSTHADGARRRAGRCCSCATACRCSIRGATSRWIGRTQPLETIKRIEVVTGPGGVLWGANSFLGIVNLITKDAEDVNGLEVSRRLRRRPGQQAGLQGLRAVRQDLLQRQAEDLPARLVRERTSARSSTCRSSSPRRRRRSRAASPTTRRTRRAIPTRSWMVIVDGKYSFGPLSLYYMVPFGDDAPEPRLRQRGRSRRHLEPLRPLRRPRVQGSLRQGSRRADGQGLRHPVRPRLRRSQLFPVERRSCRAIRRKPADTGGLNFNFAGQQIFRVGGTADLDVNLPFNIRLLAGGEFFYEGMRDVDADASTSRSTRPRCRSSARSARRRLRALAALPAQLRRRHRPLRRRRLRRRAVAPVPEADARRRRSYPEGLRRSAPTTWCRSARPPSSTTSCPTFTSSSTTRPASARRCSRTRRFPPAASTYGSQPEPADRGVAVVPGRAQRATACATCARSASSSCAPTTRTRCCRDLIQIRSGQLRQHRQARHPLGRGLRASST